MKNSELIIVALLVCAAFVVGFLNTTNSSPKLENSSTNSLLNIDASTTNEEQNLKIIKFDLETKTDSFEMDSIISDSLVN